MEMVEKMVFSLSNVNPNNFFANPGIVSGNELTQVTNELLGNVQPAQIPQANVNDNLISQTSSLIGTDSTQVLKLAATNQAAYDITLSNTALSAIQSLNSNAATLQLASLSRSMDGKVYVPTEFPNTLSDLKAVFTSDRPAQFFSANSLDKDKRGSNSSFSSNNRSQNQTTQGVGSTSENSNIFTFNNDFSSDSGLNLVI